MKEDNGPEYLNMDQQMKKYSGWKVKLSAIHS